MHTSSWWWWWWHLHGQTGRGRQSSNANYFEEKSEPKPGVELAVRRSTHRLQARADFACRCVYNTDGLAVIRHTEYVWNIHCRVSTENRKQRWLLAFKETNQNSQEVKNERFLIWTRQDNARIFGKCCLRQSNERTNIRYKTRNVVNTQLNVTFEDRSWKVPTLAKIEFGKMILKSVHF